MFVALAAQLTPDSEGLLVRAMIYLFGVSWKSSLSGFLSLCMGTFAVITSGIAPLIALYPNSHAAKVWALITGVMAVFAGCAKFWVGLLMTDAGTVVAKVPGTKEPQIVPSTEVPVDSSNKVIKP